MASAVRECWTLLCCSGVAALVACSTLPEYAAPKGRVLDPALFATADVISYRTLTRADFKAEQIPPEFASVAGQAGAATCAYIITTPDTQVRSEPFRSADGVIRYRATCENLRFFTQMDRDCSWWNPKEVGLPMEYILEHEQVHFAIFELESRRLNGSISEIEGRLQATADSPEEAARIISQMLEAQIEGRMKDILKRSRAFDQDTSMGHNPEGQKRWWSLVHSELAAPAP